MTLVKRAFTSFVTAGMFFVRMLLLGFMALLQLTARRRRYSPGLSRNGRSLAVPACLLLLL